MKRYVSFIILLSLAFCFTGSAESYYKLPNEAYYHTDPDCHFGAEVLPYSEGETALYTLEEAAGVRPCPSCASSHEPTFSGDFPNDWDADVRPWALGTPETWLDNDILSKWGDVPMRINELVPDGDAYPKDYGGLFRNACGGYTLLMVDSSPEKISKWKKALNCDFWVMNAEHPLNDLLGLYGAISGIIPDNEYDIIGCGVMVTLNRVEIGTSDTSDENRAAIARYLDEIGFPDPGMVWIVPMELSEDEF